MERAKDFFKNKSVFVKNGTQEEYTVAVIETLKAFEKLENYDKAIAGIDRLIDAGMERKDVAGFEFTNGLLAAKSIINIFVK